MIGFRNNRPLLKLGDCLITEYGEQWLADALEHAARRAGTTLPFLSLIQISEPTRRS